MEEYLIKNYYDPIVMLLNDTNDKTYASLHVDLIHLQQHKFDWFQALTNDVHNELPKWNAALYTAQKVIASKEDGFLEIGYQIKTSCHIQFVHVPPPDPRFKLPFPNHDQINLFREVKGTVVRMSQSKLLEVKRDFICSKCHTTVTVHSDYCLMYQFEVPKCCTKQDCKGNVHQRQARPPRQYCVNYQELKIQEALSDKNIPPTLVVTLESDLVDSCKPGDCVTICGTIERRWPSFHESKCEAVIMMRAVSLIREQNSLRIDSANLAEQMMTFKADWIEHLQKHGELGIRDIILKSICPDIYGMYPIKLAIALAICSGNEISDIKSNDLDGHHRGQSHVLLVGDPGMAKSKLLLNAVQIAPRAVHTTGMGCSSAGLTAAAVKEGSEWVLEAGALVLADGGICCIDEFNMMRESDRASIHEAMEQQTISMAKAGIVCKLNTRCAILAAANPKNLSSMSESDGTSSINIGIATPLLSRFDLVFILRDERIPEWDEAIADHLLAQVTTGFKGFSIEVNGDLWSQQKLQSHFDAISQVYPKMTPIANEILGKYYQRCRSDPERDLGRTTIRLLDSLNRLAEAHARLVFRDEITAVDAIVTIRLMESTFGFGRIVKSYDVVKEELPLGPGPDEIKHILNIFDVDPKETLQNNSSAKVAKNGQEFINPSVSSSIHPPCSQISINNDNTSSKSTTQLPKGEPFNMTKPSQPTMKLLSNYRSSIIQPTIDMDLDELDEVLSLDNNQPSQKSDKITNENAISDDEDLVCSQALDSIEEILSLTEEPAPKIPKIDHEPLKRPTNRLNLNRFTFVAPKKQPNMINSIPSTSTKNSNENKPIQSSNVDKPMKNRIFCTPSDDESSGNDGSQQRKSVDNLPFLNLTKFSGQRSVLHQQNVIESKKADKSENDSAYDSMQSNLSASMVNTFGSAAKTGKTPPIYPTSSWNTTDDDDLSYLDTLDFE